MKSIEINRLQQHLEQLAGERNPRTSPQSLRAAGDLIAGHFESIGLAVSREEVPFDGASFQNIYGTQAGTDPERGAFIIGAHYDTVEGSPGADDNASAVAALLEIARCLQGIPLRVPVIFTGFTLEEYGFVGSRLMAERLRKDDANILGMISLEMLGYRTRQPASQTYPPYIDPRNYPDTGDFIAVVGNEPSSRLTQALADALKQKTPALGVEHLLLPGRGDAFHEMRLSDHCPFWENDFKAVMVTDTAFFRNPHYHQPSDTVATLDLEFMRDIAAGLVSYLTDPAV